MRVARSALQEAAMNRLIAALALGIVVVVAGVAIYLFTVQIPAPTAPVEKTIPNDRFQHS
jgi:hypothetical protein